VKKLKRNMQKHNEKDPKNVVNNVTANLVIDFLKDHGHDAIASELLKLSSKTDLPNLHGLKLTDLVSFFSETHHAEVLVHPKVRANKKVTDFR
jgi:hypothetical protein